MHLDNYNHNSREKKITELAFTVSSNTYYLALMLVGRRFEKIPSKRLLFSQYAVELWYSMLSMLKVCVIEERLDTFKGDV